MVWVWYKDNRKPLQAFILGVSMNEKEEGKLASPEVKAAMLLGTAPAFFPGVLGGREEETRSKQGSKPAKGLVNKDDDKAKGKSDEHDIKKK
jgi:hypothetical protein